MKEDQQVTGVAPLRAAALPGSAPSQSSLSRPSRAAATNAFTPGPWSLAPAAVIVGADGRRVCSIAVRLDTADVADAHLIAAAPDLFEALELFARLEVPKKSVGNAGAYSIPFKRIERAQAALAKARGEQP